jgi:hypothetical protein
LNSIQLGWLWVARRHRKGRVLGTKAVAFLKTGEYRAATRYLMSALAVWPLLAIDFHGILLALKALTNREPDQPAMPAVWPEWDE